MIEFNRVTWYSKMSAAIVLLGLLPAWTFFLGMRYQEARDGIELDAKVQIASTRNVFRHLSSSQKDFSSQKLGVAFDYKNSGNPVLALEKGSKVYVYQSADSTEGQFIEVFIKNPKESFSEAIKRIILKNYPSPDCKIELVDDSASRYQKAIISYPESDVPGQDWFVNMDLCNPKYDVTDGIRYFFYDPSHPDRFFFLSIGQYGITTEKGEVWQDTIVINSVR